MKMSITDEEWEKLIFCVASQVDGKGDVLYPDLLKKLDEMKKWCKEVDWLWDQSFNKFFNDLTVI